LKWGIPAIAGAVAGATAIDTGQMSLGIPSAGFVIKGISELIQSARKRREFRQKVPMSIFIDLENG
jgi:hypothetical protein